MKKIDTDGYIFKIGDVILGKHAFGTNKYVISRVTNNYAFAKINDNYEAKFKRVYNSWAFQPLPRKQFNTTTFTIYSKDI